MFNARQLAYMRALASQSVGSVQISFNRTRLLVRTGPSDDDWAVLLVFICFAGMILLPGLLIAYLHKVWSLGGGVALALVGLYWAARRVLASRAQTQQQPPNFLYDSTQHCFYLLADSSKSAQPHYERYPGHSLAATRVRILSSNEYFDDTVIEFSFDNEQWVQALRLNNSPLAYELEQAIKYCQSIGQRY